MIAYYNEWDRYPAAWLRNLIDAGHIARGNVDERSIRDVRATDVVATQCHFFAGIGGWSYALRLAGWPDDRPVWTASCPCQPFSTAGKRRGATDDRHLWPALFELVRQCRPPILFGEQVAGPAGREWFDAVSADLEGAGYAVGAANLSAACVGAQHIRQRLYFVAVADADHAAPQGRRERRDGGNEWAAGSRGVVGGMADGVGDSDREPGRRDSRAVYCAEGGGRRRPIDHGSRVAGVDVLSAWADAEWIACTDGKSRPAQPGSFPLAHGVPERVGADGAVETRSRRGELAGYGNAIVPQVAAAFVRAVMG